MAPLPPIWDPAKAVDRLPQPFRMIDKLLAEIVERALDTCLAKEKQKRVIDATHIDTVISPHAAVVVHGQTSCFTTLGVGGMVIVGTTEGQVLAHTARDPTQVGRDQPHTSGVTGLDVGHVAATGTKVVASASRERLVVHDVVLRTSQMRLLATVDLPQDPDMEDPEAPCAVTFSNNAGHVAVSWPGGAVAVYEVVLPACLYDSDIMDRPPDAPPLDMSGGKLLLCMHYPLRIVRALLVGNTVIGACTVVWQQQQRPDKSGKSDRNHRPAKGVYMWWMKCNKLALTYLDAGSGMGVKLPPIQKVSLSSAALPQTPPGAGKAAKGKPPPTAGTVTEVAMPEVPTSATDASAKAGVIMTPSKGWLLPVGITHSCYSENGKMLAFGLTDGSTLVWDDHFVTALAFVNGAPNLLFVTSLNGSVYLADLNKPEDSHMSKTRLPHAAHQVLFLPNDPFAICICNQDADQQPRLVWFNMQDEKLAAELSGKNATPEHLGFGRAGLAVPLRLPKPTPPEAPAPPLPTPVAAAAKPGNAKPGAAPPPPPPIVVDTEPPEAVLAAAQAAADAKMLARPWPAISFRDTYLVAGGPIMPAAAGGPATAGDGSGLGLTPPSTPPGAGSTGAAPQPVTATSVPSTPGSTGASTSSPCTTAAHLYLYKLDAIARMLLPEELAGAASKSLLNRMLADLNPPKIRRRGQPEPVAAPKPSSMRKASDVDPDPALGGRRHIKFNEADLEGLLNEEQKSGKLFKKETIKGGYSEGRSKQINDTSDGSGSGAPPGILDLSAFGPSTPSPAAAPAYMQERPKSPPWHHTNPLARIHPDWEEAAVLARIMEKLGNKGGGRRRRERRLGTVYREMQAAMAKEAGAKPALLFQQGGP